MPFATDALLGRRILVVEDEWFLADYIVASIQAAGGEVTGPCSSVRQTLDLLGGGAPPPDAATLDIQLIDGQSYPVAEELARLGVPFVFASAFDPSTLPARFARRPILTKPFAAYQVVEALTALGSMA